MQNQKSPEQIQLEIAETRARMEARIENVSQQATPSGLVSGLLNSQASPTGDMMDEAVRRFKSNPLAALAIGAGLFGLTKSASKMQPVQNDEHVTRADLVAGDPANRVREHASNIRGDVDTLIADAQSKIDEGRNAAKASAKRISREAEDQFASFRENSDAFLSATREQAQELPQRAKYEAENAAAWVKENPVPASLVALAVGATAAAIFAPKSSVSDKPVRRERAVVPTDDESAKKPVRKKVAKAKTVKRASRKTPRKPRAVKVPSVAQNAKAPAPTATKPPRTDSSKTAADATLGNSQI